MNLHIHQVETVQYLHSIHFPVWFWVLGSYQEGCTQDWCSRSMATLRKLLEIKCHGTTMFGMMMWDGKPSNHMFWLLFKHGDSPYSATLHDYQMSQVPSRTGELETTWMPPYYVDEDYTAGPEINEPFHQWANWRGSESSTLEINVYIWCYALILVHARNEWMNDLGKECLLLLLIWVLLS